MPLFLPLTAYRLRDYPGFISVWMLLPAQVHEVENGFPVQ